MARSISLRTKERLKQYFNGELKRKARKFKEKSKQKFPDEYYCTLHSVSYVVTAKNSNGISDPTGERAVKLADMALERIRKYNQYLALHRTITDVLQGAEKGEIYLLKVYVGFVDGGFTAAAKKVNLSQVKAKRKVIALANKVDRKISGVVVREKQKTFGEYKRGQGKKGNT